MRTLASFVKAKRKAARLTQVQFADRAGVALTVIRKTPHNGILLSRFNVSSTITLCSLATFGTSPSFSTKNLL